MLTLSDDNNVNNLTFYATITVPRFVKLRKNIKKIVCLHFLSRFVGPIKVKYTYRSKSIL